MLSPIPWKQVEGERGVSSLAALKTALAIVDPAETIVTDEAELAAALAASARLLRVTRDITLTADKNILVDCEIALNPGVTVTCGAFAFIAAAAVDVRLKGPWSLVTWARASGNAFQLGAGATLSVDGVNLTNLGSAINTAFATIAEDQSYARLTLTSPNASGGGIVCSGALRIKDLVIVSGGTSGNDVIYALNADSVLVKGLILRGASWPSAVSTTVFIGGTSLVTVEGVVVEDATATARLQFRNASISNLVHNGPGNIDSFADCSFTNVRIFSGTIELGEDSEVNGGVCNTLDYTGTGCTADVRVNAAIAMDQAFCKFEGIVDASVLITVSGDDCSIVGARVGTKAGSGSGSITVNAGADRTIITGTRTDAAISDSGTGTVTAGNATY